MKKTVRQKLWKAFEGSGDIVSYMLYANSNEDWYMPIKTLGLVARTVNYRDNDRMLTLISPDYGRLSALCRGCRKIGGKLMACSQLFCYGEYTLYEKSGRMGVMSCDIHKSFFGVSRNMDTLYAASEVIRACLQASLENHAEPSLFSLAVYALDYIESGAVLPKDMLAVSLIKLCGIMGYAPRLDECAVCGKKQKSGFLDASLGGLVCPECNNGADRHSLDEREIRIICGVLRCPNKELERVCPMKDSLYNAFNDYFSYYIRSI